jgi:assimilatory nitrate reductase catalytic subunit
MVDKLASAKPRPVLQMHPALARRHGVAAGDRVTLESRRGRAEFRVEVTADVRPDTLFAPFHWGGKEAANALTNAALDPTSRMPEFKLAAVRVVSVSKGERQEKAMDRG